MRPLLVLLVFVAVFDAFAPSLGADICYHNPVINRDFADPCVLQTSNAELVAFSTNAAGINVPCAISSGGSSLASSSWVPCASDALPSLPSWTKPGRVWAPKVVERLGRFVMFYTTVVAATGRQCVSFATSNHSTGPYVDSSSEPFVCQSDHGGTIDPSYFYDKDTGKHYLLFKNDGNCCDQPVFLWSQELDWNKMKLIGEQNQLLGVSQPWEGVLVEAPAMHKFQNTFYLLYSCNDYDSWQYRVGYAVCTSPAGPCSKESDSPFMQLSSDTWGPGGTEWFSTRSGHLFICYHAWTAPKGSYASGGARSFRVDPISFVDRGRPHFVPILSSGGPTDWPVCV